MNQDQPSPSRSEPGTYLAVERTFLAWVRTGVALMGFGFVVARFGFFLRELAMERLTPKDPHAGFSLPVGITLIAAGILVTLVAAVRHHRYIKALDRGEFREAFGTGFALLVAGLLACVGLAVAVYLTVLL